MIENKCKIKKNKNLLYAAIFSDGKHAIALEFNKDGIVINKSSLLLEDEILSTEIMSYFNLIISIVYINSPILISIRLERTTWVVPSESSFIPQNPTTFMLR